MEHLKVISKAPCQEQLESVLDRLSGEVPVLLAKGRGVTSRVQPAPQSPLERHAGTGAAD